jgi:hypothetical protein
VSEAGTRRKESGEILRTNSGEAGMCVDCDAIEDSVNPIIETASNM